MRGPQDSLSDWLLGQGLKPVETFTTYLVLVTPAIAEAWLGLNTGNRKPSAAKVRRFATIGADGKWRVNGETIKFSSTGRLIDGQSRLCAIIESGISVMLEIRAGIADDAQRTMDCGEARRATHTLEMLGQENAAVLSPALRLLYKMELGGLAGGGSKGRVGVMENLAIPQMLVRHSGISDSVTWAVNLGSRIRRFMPLSEAAFFHFAFSAGGLQLRDSFFDGLRSANGMSQPVALLRSRILDGAQGRLASGLRIKLVVKAWNAHANRRNMRTLVLTPRESCAPIHGLQGQAPEVQETAAPKLSDVERIIADAAL